MNPRRLVQPAAEPVSLADVKLFLRIEHDAEDSLLSTLLQAAREAAESFLSVSFLEQTWQYTIEHHQDSWLNLPMSPVLAVAEIAMRDDASAWVVQSSSAYALIGDRIKLSPELTFQSALRVHYTAGMASDAANIPATIKHALLEHVTKLYETRGLDDVLDISHIYASLREVRV